MNVKVFWCEPSGESIYTFRRYAQSNDCSSKRGYHNAHTPWYRGATITDARGYILSPDAPSDAAWPVKCEDCEYAFTDADSRQVFTEQLYRRPDTGEEWKLRELPLGAMWNAWRLADLWHGADGMSLTVKLPFDHDWHVDARCSNCTRPNEPHQCWVRHGDPRTGNVHVDKNGNTCSAGGGSILIPGYHGFLHNGELTDVPA